MVAPEPIVSVPEPNAPASLRLIWAAPKETPAAELLLPLNVRTPAFTEMEPVNVLLPFKNSVPAPDLLMEPAPDITPLSVRLLVVVTSMESASESSVEIVLADPWDTKVALPAATSNVRVFVPVPVAIVTAPFVPPLSPNVRLPTVMPCWRRTVCAPRVSLQRTVAPCAFGNVAGDQFPLVFQLYVVPVAVCCHVVCAFAPAAHAPTSTATKLKSAPKPERFRGLCSGRIDAAASKDAAVRGNVFIGEYRLGVLVEGVLQGEGVVNFKVGKAFLTRRSARTSELARAARQATLGCMQNQ